MSHANRLAYFALGYNDAAETVDIINVAGPGDFVTIDAEDIPLLIESLTNFLRKKQDGTLFDHSTAAAIYEMTESECRDEPVPPIATETAPLL